MKKITLINIILSLLLQIVTVISGLIVPRLILSTFGSNVNGLVSSISQFLNYIALIEGGVTGVISANLYKPLVEKDWEKTSSIIATARSFYRKIGLFFIAYTVVIGLVYPVIVETGYSATYVFILTCTLSIGLLLQYMFSLTMTTLLNADKRVYIVSAVSIMLTIGNVIMVVVVVKHFPDIILLKAASALLFAFRPIILGAYINKHYEIDWNATRDNSLIKQRWNGFAINIAFFIHTSTDITILTLMTDLKTVSVYSVYYLVVSNISVLVHSIASGIEPTIGQAYARGNSEEIHEKMDLYEFITFYTVGIMFALTGLLITPFVQLFTSGITDANYYQPIFGSLLVISETLYLIKYPHVTLAYSANKFKDITTPAYIEALINIVISVILVKYFGLLGVAIGTAAGMLYRMGFHIAFTKKILTDRNQIIFYRKMIIMTVTTTIGIVVALALFPFEELTVVTWIVHAVVYGMIIATAYLVTAIIFFNKELQYFFNYMKRR